MERRRPGQGPPTVASFLPGPSSLIFVVNSNDRDRVEEAKEELIERGQMGDVVVLAFANTHTPSTTTCSGQKFTDVSMHEDLW